MTPSTYQKAIYDHFAARSGNCAVIAVAGSGKTTTAIEAIGHLPLGISTLLGAFNTSIRDEFKARGEAKGYKNVTYTNYNGFGWGICRKNLKRMPELDKFKTRNVLEFKVFKPSNDEDEKTMRFWATPIEKLVEAFRCLAIFTPEEAWEQYEDIVDHFNLDVPVIEDFKRCTVDTFVECLKHREHYDFTDQKFMPIYHNWPIPTFDQVIIDEFQDTCPIELMLMSRAVAGQMAALGDPDQTIYGFKFADPRRFGEFKKDMNARELPLSVCYRCPTAVIDEAKKIVARIEAAPGASRGYVGTRKYAKFLEMAEGKDFVLCRTTEDLIKAQIEFTKMGKRSKVRGREFGTALESIITRVSGDDKGMSIDKFTDALMAYSIERAEQLTALRREGEIDNLEDRVNTIRALCDGAFRVDDIYERMNSIFTDAPHDGVDLMTCHKSKGLQAQNVYVLRPDLLPHPRSRDREWMAEEENRLKYVTITRSQENLVWVDPK